MSKYICKLCNKKFKTYCGGTRHETRGTCLEKKFQCNKCLHRFSRKNSLSHHKNHTCKITKDFNEILEDNSNIEPKLKKNLPENDLNIELREAKLKNTLPENDLNIELREAKLKNTLYEIQLNKYKQENSKIRSKINALEFKLTHGIYKKPHSLLE